jgi:integrase
MKKGETGLGTVRKVFGKSGELLGYRALLPRELSDPPPKCKNPDTYQEPVGPMFDSEDKARRVLRAAIIELTEKRSLRHGLPFSNYVGNVIREKLQKARRIYPSAGRANLSVSTWRSIDRVWLKDAPFYEWLPNQIEVPDLQHFIDSLSLEDGKNGDPLSAHFIRNVGVLLKASFGLAGRLPNPMDSVRFPPRGKPRVEHLDLASQHRFFSSGIELIHRRMVGCGMGAGLRVGELLSIELADVFINDADPHLFVRYGGPGRSPTKGRAVRRVELFEPGLGFWQQWLDNHLPKGSPLVFAGPMGGYQKSWPELFPSWAPAAGRQAMTSHIMRHSYAVAMLSGSWGYEPKSLEFVQHQLGHTDQATTEKYYGAFEHGTWQRDVRRMTGRETEAVQRIPLTANALLGL